MQRTCQITGQQFETTEQELAFLQKMNLPVPNICYQERLRKRLAFRNDRKLFHRTCDQSGKQLISMYPADSPQTVIDKEIWWSESYDATSYGRDFDFSRPFFDQFYELMIAVPHPNLITLNSTNSEFTNYNGWNNNCYLCFAGNTLEDSCYCYNVENSKDCYDCLNLFESELCYQCVESENLYNCFFALHSKNCSESYFIEDCIGCRNCIFCYNLNNKEYCIQNQQVTKEQYEQYLKDLQLNTKQGLETAYNFWRSESLKHPKKALHNIQTENCTGEYISQSKNCHNCYMVHAKNEDCNNIFNGFPIMKDSQDCCFSGENSELINETNSTGANAYNCICTMMVINNCKNISYSDYLIGCEDCLGCSGMHKKKYCILNKQYAKEEYETLKTKIIQHMKQTDELGQFFPIKFSPFAYNESVAQDYFPLSKQEIDQRGYKYKDPDQKEYQPQTYQVPQNITDAPEDITQQILACTKTGKNFKLIAKDLAFYKKFSLAIPDLCPDQRHMQRLHLKNPPEIYQRTCAKTGQPILTSYSPDRPEIVYSEQAYNELVYG